MCIWGLPGLFFFVLVVSVEVRVGLHMQRLQRTETHMKVAFKSKCVVICPQALQSLYWL